MIQNEYNIEANNIDAVNCENTIIPSNRLIPLTLFI